MSDQTKDKVNPQNESSDLSKYIEQYLPRSSSRNWFPSLDGLRAIAVILVFLEHVSGNVFSTASGEDKILDNFLNFSDSGMGRSGVHLFFVLSSFLLTKQLLKPRTSLKDKGFWLNYGFRRCIRIYPLYLVILLVYLIFPGFKYSIGDFISHVLLQKANNHFWTIPVEMKYYLLLPGFVLLITNIFKRKIKAFLFSVLQQLLQAKHLR